MRVLISGLRVSGPIYSEFVDLIFFPTKVTIIDDLKLGGTVSNQLIKEGYTPRLFGSGNRLSFQKLDDSSSIQYHFIGDLKSSEDVSAPSFAIYGSNFRVDKK